MPPLAPEDAERYARHLALPEVGPAGQERLRAASVLLVGAGGLGSPVALYLAAAGVGRLGIVDDDVVDRSNLQRQVLFGEKDVGRSKARAAKERLMDLAPRIRVDAHETRFRAENAHALLHEYDILVDATDNFPTRYLANDVAALQGKPVVFASIHRFEGQVSVFDAKRGPCYRCLFARPPPPELVPSCAEAGVLGVLPGLVGSIQATEVLKLILGVGEPLVGKLLLVDARAMEFTTLRLAKDPACPLCGPRATLRALIDYEAFCGAPARTPEAEDLWPRDLEARLRTGPRPFVLDVREPWEAEVARIEGSVLIPLGELPGRAHEVPRDRDVVVVCHHGIRSGRAADLLRSLGHPRVANLLGGIEAWASQVDPAMARY